MEAEPQEGGGIARAWIVDPKVYPVYQCSMTMFMPEWTVVATGVRLVKILGFLLIILARFCWLTSWKVLEWRHSLVSFKQKKTPRKI